MTPLLTYLVWAAVLTFVQMLVAVLLALPDAGLPKLAGNREGMPELPGAAGRAERAHLNMLQSLVLFAILALVAHLSQRATPSVVLGAQVFLYARVAYAILYVAGIPWIRTLVWGISVVGLVMMAVPLLT